MTMRTGADLGVPEHAAPAWRALHEQIAHNGPTPCAGPDRDNWTGTAAQQERAAEACLECFAMVACAAYADTAHESTGVWGGLTSTERQHSDLTRRPDERTK